MNVAELELLKNTLEEAERANTGSGHWLPEKFKRDLRESIKLVKREIQILKVQPQVERIRLEDRTIIKNRDGSTTTFYDDDDLQ